MDINMACGGSNKASSMVLSYSTDHGYQLGLWQQHRQWKSFQEGNPENEPFFILDILLLRARVIVWVGSMLGSEPIELQAVAVVPLGDHIALCLLQSHSHT